MYPLYITCVFNDSNIIYATIIIVLNTKFHVHNWPDRDQHYLHRSRCKAHTGCVLKRALVFCAIKLLPAHVYLAANVQQEIRILGITSITCVVPTFLVCRPCRYFIWMHVGSNYSLFNDMNNYQWVATGFPLVYRASIIQQFTVICLLNIHVIKITSLVAI